MKQFGALFSLPGDLTDAWRQKMWQRSEQLKPPVPKGPGFDYVPLAKYYAKNYQLPNFTAALDVTNFILPECASGYLVYVDGIFHPEMSCIPSSIIALPLAKAMKSYGLFIQHRLQKTLKEETDFFALVNGACHGQSLFLYIPPETKLAHPLQILHISSSRQTLAMPRTQCVIGKGAQIQIVQTSSQHDSSAVFDCVLDEMARLSFYDASVPSCSAWQMQTFRAFLKKDSFLQAFFLTTGSETVRNHFAIELTEEGSEALIKGLSMLSNKAESHFYGKVEHKAPHCKSRQQIKSILSGSSKSSFEGKIFVHPTAQKTEAYQHSQSLILSPSATTFTKPNLEIFADDVKASHGATISQPDAESLFYLRSRGLSLEEARRLLIQGFCQEMLEELPFASLKNTFLEALFHG